MKYAVTIQATVTKTYMVEAENEDLAVMEAQENFSVLNEEGIDENYQQDLVTVEKVD
jgi:hypothetical protein